MSRGRRVDQGTLFELDEDEEEAVAAESPLELPLELAVPREAMEPSNAAAVPLRARALAAGVDLAAHALAAGIAVGGALLLDVMLRPAQVPGFALLLLVFSLFYTVVPLAFWGRTAGMAVAGIACRGEDDQPLSFSEAGRRWLGSLLTVVLLGLPALMLLGGGRSPADRLSGRIPVVD